MVVFASLPRWIVDDGQLAVPYPRMLLKRTGLRAHCSSVGASSGESWSVRPVSGGMSGPRVLSYELQGRAGAASDVLVDQGDGTARRVAAEFVVDVGEFGC